jgi:hypothetical protein
MMLLSGFMQGKMNTLLMVGETASCFNYIFPHQTKHHPLVFLAHGCKRYGKVTSNPAENINSAVIELRGKPIMDMILTLSRYINHKHQERFQVANSLLQQNHKITPWGSKILLKINALARFCTVVVTSRNDTTKVAKAVVKNSSGFEFYTTVDAQNFEVQCNCNWSLEYGIPCCQ